MTINLPIRLDNNKRITGMRCGGPRGSEGGGNAGQEAVPRRRGVASTRGARDLKC